MAALVVFAGIANAALLAIINAAAENARDEAANGRMLALFGVAIALYLFVQRHVMFTAITEVERLLSGIRTRIADGIRKADLYPLEQVGRSEIYGLVSRETQMISQAAGTLLISLQSTMMVAFSVVYILILSKAAFVITVLVTSLGLFIHFRRSEELNALLHNAQRRENDFLSALTDLLDGFKEARLHQRRSA